MGVPAACSPGIQRSKLPRNKWLHIFSLTLTASPERKVWDNQRGFTAVSNLLFPHPFFSPERSTHTYMYTYCRHACTHTWTTNCILKRWSIKYLIFHQCWQRPLSKTSHFYWPRAKKGPGGYYSSTEQLAQSIDFLLLDCSLSVKPAHTVRVREMGRETWELYEGQERTIEPPEGKALCASEDQE